MSFSGPGQSFTQHRLHINLIPGLSMFVQELSAKPEQCIYQQHQQSYLSRPAQNRLTSLIMVDIILHVVTRIFDQG